MECDHLRHHCGLIRLDHNTFRVPTHMKHLAVDGLAALFWVVMQPVYWVVRRAVHDEMGCSMGHRPDPPGSLRWPEQLNQLALAEEIIEVWEPIRQ